MTGPALQQCLAAEHAAVYVFAALAAQTSQREQPVLWAALDSGYQQHRSARDALVARVRDAGLAPVAAAPAYALPNAASSPDLVYRAALRIERRITRTYATGVASTGGADRSFAIRTLGASAVRQLAFRGSPEIFPGTAGL